MVGGLRCGARSARYRLWRGRSRRQTWIGEWSALSEHGPGRVYMRNTIACDIGSCWGIVVKVSQGGMKLFWVTDEKQGRPLH